MRLKHAVLSAQHLEYDQQNRMLVPRLDVLFDPQFLILGCPTRAPDLLLADLSGKVRVCVGVSKMKGLLPFQEVIQK